MISKLKKNTLMRRTSLFDRKEETPAPELTPAQMKQLEEAVAKEVEKILTKPFGGGTSFTIKF